MRKTGLGTVLSLSSTSVEDGTDLVRVGLSRGGQELNEAARRLEIMLDYLLWNVTETEDSWLLDPRYADMLDSKEAETASTLRGVAVPVPSHWKPLDRRLSSMGRPQV
ncbi:MAG: hypothetical protein ACR2F6_00190 [Mycobacteriales bacterium]